MIHYLFWVWYFVGALLLLLFEVPRQLQFSNALFLIFYALYAIHVMKRGKPKMLSDQSAIKGQLVKGWLPFIVIWTGGMTVEWVGVHSGRLFGSYVYSDILGPQLYGVPVTLGFAWIAVVINAFLITRDLGLSGVRLIVVRAYQVGFWAVLMDLVLDPVAHARGFWHWNADGGFYGVPGSNFVGWFMVGAMLSLILPQKSVTFQATRLGTRLYQAILIMFGLLGAREGLPLCTVIAVIGILLSEGSLRYAGSHKAEKI
ncbi:carotenoid biosynthesis protein [Paenibacillus sp. GCM10012306]